MIFFLKYDAQFGKKTKKGDQTILNLSLFIEDEIVKLAKFDSARNNGRENLSE